MGQLRFSTQRFYFLGFRVEECDKVVSDILPWAYIWSFQLPSLRFTERRSESLRLAGGNAKHTKERVVFHGFSSSSPLPMPPYRWLPTVWPVQNPICSIPISKKWHLEARLCS